MWFFGRDKIEIPKRARVEIRMEAIGGQGANSAGKILAEAAILELHYTGNHFSSFGSEKRGTPVKSFVRFSTERKPVRSASFIRKPNLLVIFHEVLMETHPEIFEGVSEDTDILINSPKYPSEIFFPKGVHPRWLGSIDATKIAHKLNCGLNTVMLGAMIPFLPEVGAKSLEKVTERFFVRLSPEARTGNVEGFKKGLDEVKIKTILPNQDRIRLEKQDAVRLGYENAPLGGLIIHPGNSVLKNHEASRKGFAPKLDKDVCFNCGMCDQVCPDFCFVWQKNPNTQFGAELLGLDYQYCKGCQKCIQVCPVQALTLTPESELSSTDKSISWVESLK